MPPQGGAGLAMIDDAPPAIIPFSFVPRSIRRNTAIGPFMAGGPSADVSRLVPVESPL